ncbi:hypothetical protein OC846_003673 [Tilletia horrida]|uniref:Uncharacterized protein n=1 Tax=Tilletia horrida TaxID=155126 RepID=A0AAN6GNQ2_9BASI|nr:hypothetical protein OC846_003673 [Tilletia horrida]KAK0565546.1 hypothetical protein OC861_003708 [Tilletia horrida]
MVASIATSSAPTARKRERSPAPKDDADLAFASTPKADSVPSKPVDYGWPAPSSALHDAEQFILQSVRSGQRILIVPDKDADGLSAGAILHRTLRQLGVENSRISVHLMSKGNHPGSSKEREAMEAIQAKWVIVLDQGSREGPPLVRGAEHGWQWHGHISATSARSDSESTLSVTSANRVHTMILDHHFLTDPLSGGPKGALMVNASHSAPVATTALLTWHICRPLLTRSKSQGGGGLSDQEAEALVDWLCLIGTMGDLGVSLKWEPPFPNMDAKIKMWTKKRIGTAIALLNAPRRTPTFDTISAWRVLLKASSPASITDALQSPTDDPEFSSDVARLYQARETVATETERCTHTPPKFSKDGRVALLRIHSAFQVHPSIATRWSGTLRGAKKLQAVMCANDGYSEVGGGDEPKASGGMTHFSCRIAQAAKRRAEDPNLIELLHDYAARDPSFLRDLKAATEGQEQAPEADVDPTTTSTTDQSETRVSVGNFARGHRQASGGIIPHAFFERLVNLMEIGVKDESASGSPSKKRKTEPVQSNTISNYFKKA